MSTQVADACDKMKEDDEIIEDEEEEEEDFDGEGVRDSSDTLCVKMSGMLRGSVLEHEVKDFHTFFTKIMGVPAPLIQIPAPEDRCVFFYMNSLQDRRTLMKKYRSVTKPKRGKKGPSLKWKNCEIKLKLILDESPHEFVSKRLQPLRLNQALDKLFPYRNNLYHEQLVRKDVASQKVIQMLLHDLPFEKRANMTTNPMVPAYPLQGYDYDVYISLEEDPDTHQVLAGIRVYALGTTGIVPLDMCHNIPLQMAIVTRHFVEHMPEIGLKAIDPSTAKGDIVGLAFRMNQYGQCILALGLLKLGRTFVPMVDEFGPIRGKKLENGLENCYTNVSKRKLVEIRKTMESYYTKHGKQLGIESIFIRYVGLYSVYRKADEGMVNVHILGSPHSCDVYNGFTYRLFGEKDQCAPCFQPLMGLIEANLPLGPTTKIFLLSPYVTPGLYLAKKCGHLTLVHSWTNRNIEEVRTWVKSSGVGNLALGAPVLTDTKNFTVEDSIVIVWKSNRPQMVQKFIKSGIRNFVFISYWSVSTKDYLVKQHAKILEIANKSCSIRGVYAVDSKPNSRTFALAIFYTVGGLGPLESDKINLAPLPLTANVKRKLKRFRKGTAAKAQKIAPPAKQHVPPRPLMSLMHTASSAKMPQPPANNPLLPVKNTIAPVKNTVPPANKTDPQAKKTGPPVKKAVAPRGPPPRVPPSSQRSPQASSFQMERFASGVMQNLQVVKQQMQTLFPQNETMNAPRELPPWTSKRRLEDRDAISDREGGPWANRTRGTDFTERFGKRMKVDHSDTRRSDTRVSRWERTSDFDKRPDDRSSSVDNDSDDRAKSFVCNLLARLGRGLGERSSIFGSDFSDRPSSFSELRASVTIGMGDRPTTSLGDGRVGLCSGPGEGPAGFADLRTSLGSGIDDRNTGHGINPSDRNTNFGSCSDDLRARLDNVFGDRSSGYGSGLGDRNPSYGSGHGDLRDSLGSAIGNRSVSYGSGPGDLRGRLGSGPGDLRDSLGSGIDDRSSIYGRDLGDRVAGYDRGLSEGGIDHRAFSSGFGDRGASHGSGPDDRSGRGHDNRRGRGPDDRSDRGLSDRSVGYGSRLGDRVVGYGSGLGDRDRSGGLDDRSASFGSGFVDRGIGYGSSLVVDRGTNRGSDLAYRAGALDDRGGSYSRGLSDRGGGLDDRDGNYSRGYGDRVDDLNERGGNYSRGYGDRIGDSDVRSGSYVRDIVDRVGELDERSGNYSRGFGDRVGDLDERGGNYSRGYGDRVGDLDERGGNYSRGYGDRVGGLGNKGGSYGSGLGDRIAGYGRDVVVQDRGDCFSRRPDDRDMCYGSGLGDRGGSYGRDVGDRGSSYVAGLGDRGGSYGGDFGDRGGSYGTGLDDRDGSGIGNRNPNYGRGSGDRTTDWSGGISRGRRARQGSSRSGHKYNK